ncbi:MAG: inositol monophosphatase family protein, partial [Alphaproteobacteria bacterium]
MRTALVNVMERAARRAARGLVRDFGELESLQITKKGTADFVSNADKAAEAIIRDELETARPRFGFLMEESGTIEGSDPDHRWIVDPLDGTTNFLHGLPHFAISIALEHSGRIIS